MSTRLQVVVDETEMREIRKIARRERMTVSEWVRRCLREARRARPSVDTDRQMQAVRAAARHAFPSGDIDQMLAEIEAGYGEAPARP
jgi:hypothetical protein